SLLALDHAPRDVIGDRLHDDGHLVGFRKHLAAVAGVLHEAIDALVAAHYHMRDDVDPQPRRDTLADTAIEQVYIVRHLPEQGIERLVQNLEPRHLGVAQIDDHAGAIRRLDPGLTQCVAQAHGTRLVRAARSAHWRL